MANGADTCLVCGKEEGEPQLDKLLCRGCFMRTVASISRPDRCSFCFSKDNVEEHDITATSNEHTKIDARVKLHLCRACLTAAMAHPSAMLVKGSA